MERIKKLNDTRIENKLYTVSSVEKSSEMGYKNSVSFEQED